MLTNKIRLAKQVSLAMVLVLILLVFLSAFVLAYNNYWLKTASAPDEIWTPVNYSRVETTIGLAGKISASTATTVSVPFDALVADVPHRIGERVEGGDVIVKLDKSHFEVKVRQAQLEMIKARQLLVELENWSSSDEVSRARRSMANAALNAESSASRLKDAQRLFERGIVPRLEVDNLEQQAKLNETEYLASKADLERIISNGRGDNLRVARIAFENAEFIYKDALKLLNQYELKSPYSGLLFPPLNDPSKEPSAIVQKGQRVTQGAPLMQVVSVDSLYASALINEGDLQKVRKNMPVLISGEGFKPLLLNGKVQSISSQAIDLDSSWRPSEYKVFISIDKLSEQESLAVRLGMTAKLMITTYVNEESIVVPVDHVFENDGQAYVSFRESAEHPARNVGVRIGASTVSGVEVFGIKPGFVKRQPSNP